MSLKQGTVYYNKGGFFDRNRWTPKYLVVEVYPDTPTTLKRELRLYENEVSYRSKKKCVVKGVITSCNVNKLSHDNNKKFGFRVVTDTKKCDFSVNTDDQRNKWIDFINHPLLTDLEDQKANQGIFVSIHMIPTKLIVPHNFFRSRSPNCRH